MSVVDRWDRLLLRLKQLGYTNRGKGYVEVSVKLCFGKGVLLAWQVGDTKCYEPASAEVVVDILDGKSADLEE